MEKTLYWIDRDWYDSERNKVVGDMGFSFNDATDTITDNFEELKKGMIDFAPVEIKESEEYLSEDSIEFPIYSIYKGIFDIDDDSNYLSIFDRIGYGEVVFSCAYCTSKRAEKINNSGCELKADYYACDFIEK